MTEKVTFVSPSAQAAARTLRWVRLLVFGSWVVQVASAPLSELAVLPPELLQPPWILRVATLDAWKWILTPEVLGTLQGLLLLLLSMAALGVRPYRLIATTAVGLLTVHQGLIRSYGFSSHEELVALLASYVLAAWPSSDGAAWPPSHVSRRRSALYNGGILLIATLGCWTYAATGAHRLAHHGMELLLGNSMRVYVVENSFFYSSGAVGIFFLEHPGVTRLWQIAVLVSTLFEIAAPAALVSRWFRRVWLVFLLAFHLVSATVLDVFFWQSMLIVGAALLALDRSAQHSAQSELR